MHVFFHRFEHLSVLLSNVCLFDSTTTAADLLHCSGGLASLRLCQCHCSHCLFSVSRADITVAARLQSLCSVSRIDITVAVRLQSLSVELTSWWL